MPSKFQRPKCRRLAAVNFSLIAIVSADRFRFPKMSLNPRPIFGFKIDRLKMVVAQQALRFWNRLVTLINIDTGYQSYRHGRGRRGRISKRQNFDPFRKFPKAIALKTLCFQNYFWADPGGGGDSPGS